MEPNNKIIDWWTFIHFVVGFNLGKLSRKISYPLIISYEIVENIIARKTLGEFFKEFEGLINALSDTAVGLGAYELGRKYGQVKI